MALALIITLEKDLPSGDAAAYIKGKTGKALARESDRLHTAARSRGVASLAALTSESQAVLRARMLEEGFNPDKMHLPPELWYEAAEGLKTVRSLAEYVSAYLQDFKQPNPILRDLRAAEALLTAAHNADVRFHFTKTEI